MPEQIPDEAKHLITDKNFAHVSTVNEDGSPQTSPVWVDLEDDAIVFNTSQGRVKEQNISREPRVAVSVHDMDDPYENLLVQGRAEMELDEGNTHIDRMAKKYRGVDKYEWLKDGEQRVIVRIRPEKVSYTPGH